MPKKAKKATMEPKVESKDAYYMIERLSGIQGWIWRTDGLFVVRTEYEEPFRKLMVNAGLIPVKLPIRTSMRFMDAITKYKEKG